jgi:outer membrane translocation and assembly module TamA
MVRMSAPKLDERQEVALPEVEVNHKFCAVFVRRSVEVTGTQRMGREFVRWATGIKPGEPYDPDTLTRARDRLQRLGPFSTA